MVNKEPSQLVPPDTHTQPGVSWQRLIYRARQVPSVVKMKVGPLPDGSRAGQGFCKGANTTC